MLALVLLLLAALAQAAAPPPVRSDLGCGQVSNSRWTRRLCFGPAVVDGAAPEATVWVVQNLTVSVKGNASDAAWQPACRDSLRVQFVSHRARFAPRLAEGACGVFALRYILPPDSPSYDALVWVAHVDGEGYREPPAPRLFPLNLYDTRMDGPAIYNTAATGFGQLHVGAGYARPEAVTGHFDARSAGDPAEIVGEGPLPRAAGLLPVCTDGEAPGRWVAVHSLYNELLGEPLAWRPYGCRWPLVPAPALAACLNRTGRVKFVGESTLGQLYSFFLVHLAQGRHAWPQRINEERPGPRFAHPLLRAQGLHSEFHGLSTMLEPAGLSSDGQPMAKVEAELVEYRPAAIVHLQAANDAARDTFAAYQARLANYSALLARLLASGAADAVPGTPAQLFWITAPVRHYKAGNGPGSAECPEGTLASCRAANAGFAYKAWAGDVRWLSYPTMGDSAPPLFYGTLDRRRRFNAWGVAHMRARFPGLRVIDFEALTEGLPSDYCMDGEHWMCDWEKHQNRHREPFQCRNGAGAELANILANLMCAPEVERLV